MTSFLPLLRRAYASFQTRFGPHLLGVVEIGSRAREEAVRFSDHDLRLVIYCANPLLVLNEPVWTDGLSDATTTVDWQELNPGQDLSFGLTNLAYVELGLRAGRFPLADHTCLYQGHILLDDTGTISAFRAHYQGVRFANILPDYLRQVEWRVTSRLPSELHPLTERLEPDKYAVPAIHTCYRIIRDLANIAHYQAHGVYRGDANTLARYYHEQWPWFEPTFQTLRAYKTDEQLRRAVFDDVIRHNAGRLRQIERCAAATVRLWEEFRGRFD